MKRTNQPVETGRFPLGLIVLYALGLTVVCLQLRSIFG